MPHHVLRLRLLGILGPPLPNRFLNDVRVHAVPRLVDLSPFLTVCDVPAALSAWRGTIDLMFLLWRETTTAHRANPFFTIL